MVIFHSYVSFPFSVRWLNLPASGKARFSQKCWSNLNLSDLIPRIHTVWSHDLCMFKPSFSWEKSIKTSYVLFRILIRFFCGFNIIFNYVFSIGFPRWSSHFSRFLNRLRGRKMPQAMRRSSIQQPKPPVTWQRWHRGRRAPRAMAKLEMISD